MSMIKILVMDVDGTLTDGVIAISQTGELFKNFNVKDGYGIHTILPKLGITPIIITGRSSEIVKNRFSDLGVTEIYQGVSDKLPFLKQLLEKKQVNPSEVAYIGDDLNDLECIQYVGTSACPYDSVEKVKASVDYVCRSNGGFGAVREFIDYLTGSCPIRS